MDYTNDSNVILYAFYYAPIESLSHFFLNCNILPLLLPLPGLAQGLSPVYRVWKLV